MVSDLVLVQDKPNAVGIDIGATSNYVYVTEERDKDKVRRIWWFYQRLEGNS